MRRHNYNSAALVPRCFSRLKGRVVSGLWKGNLKFLSKLKMLKSTIEAKTYTENSNTGGTKTQQFSRKQ